VITSTQVERAIVAAGITPLVIGLAGIMMLDGQLDSDGADIYENIDKAYCERVKAGTHRHYNPEIDCSKWL
jgi:hypothetical protein